MTADDTDAQELFPHTRLCIERMHSTAAVHNEVVCTCKAKAKRKTFLFLLKKTRRQAYADAYANIRQEARRRADRSQTPLERQVFEEVASWGEDMEFKNLPE